MASLLESAIIRYLFAVTAHGGFEGMKPEDQKEGGLIIARILAESKTQFADPCKLFHLIALQKGRDIMGTPRYPESVEEYTDSESMKGDIAVVREFLKTLPPQSS